MPPECCGDGLVDPSVECDDGNQIGGDGCAANCSGERLLEVATRLRATVQTALFAIPLAGDAVHRLVLGRPTHAAGMPSCFGGPSFRGGEVPVVERAGASEYAPISVPGLVCACVRPEAVKRCGPPLLNPPGPDCSLGRPCEVDSDCDDDEPCASAHGGDNSASGVIGCAGLDDVDYEATVELGVATCTRGGGPAPAGSALLHTSLRLGTITGNCFVDEGDPNKGADGIPCTEDDPASSRGGDPGTSLLTTGTARVALFSGDVVIEPERACGGSPCVASVTGSPFSCEALAAEPPETGAVALCGASALLAQAQTGDSVLTTCIEPQP